MKESVYIRWDIVPYTRGKVLHVGNDGIRLFPHFITIDEGGDGWKPDIITNLNNLSIFASQSLDAVLASYIIQHYEDKLPVLKEWWRVIKPGGYLILHYPPEFRPEIMDIMKGGWGWDLVHSEPAHEGFLQVFKKGGKKQEYSYSKEKPIKTCALVRMGGFGDMIQSTPITASLKDLGYYVKLYTSPYAYSMAQSDPNVDEFILQDKDQVPNQELVKFWAYLKLKHDKFINLSESVEGSFLTLSDRTPFEWPNKARHVYMNHNYYEFSHLIADVPVKYAPKFYATDKEIKWAEKKRRQIGGKLIMWVLAGSSVHKVYPWMDQVIARFMLETQDVNFCFVGGQDCKFLEEPWREEKRVIRLSGEIGIRETMSLAKLCDVVVGPETGVMNAVSHEQTKMVTFLSHSSHENLTKHWINNIPLEPSCECYPCHKMIYGFDQCVKGKETGVALCQESIPYESVIHAIKEQLK